MPNDPHAQKIAAERVLMDVTGLSRGQIREKLKLATDREIQQQRQAERPKAQNPYPDKGRSFTTTLEPNKFVAEPFRLSGGSGGPALEGGDWLSVTDCDGNTFEVMIRNYVAA